MSFNHALQNENQAASSEGYSSDQLREAVSVYNAQFNEAVPLDLITAAATEFRSCELMTALLNRVNENDPIKNWNAFTLQFLKS